MATFAVTKTLIVVAMMIMMIMDSALVGAQGMLPMNTTLHIIEHASFYLTIPTLSDAVIIMYNDPWDTGSGFYDGLPQADAVLLSHPHSDHFDLNALKKIAVPGTTLFISPPDVTEALVTAGYPRHTITTLKNGETTLWLGGLIGVEAVPAYNFPPVTYHPEGQWNGYVLSLGNQTTATRIYISGDSEDIPEMRQLEDIDVAFVAFNLPYTMDEPSAASAVLDFKPKVVYPYHSRDSDVEKFKALVEEGTDEVEVRVENWYPLGI